MNIQQVFLYTLALPRGFTVYRKSIMNPGYLKERDLFHLTPNGGSNNTKSAFKNCSPLFCIIWVFDVSYIMSYQSEALHPR